MMRGFSLRWVFTRTPRGALARRGVLGVFGVFGVRVITHGDRGVRSAQRTLLLLDWAGEKVDEAQVPYAGYGT